MKLSKISAALVAALAIGAASTAAMAADGTLTFTGNVTATTCSVDVGGSGTGDFTKTLADVQDTSLAADGQFAGTSTPVNIVLSGASCTNGDIMATNFEPTSATVDATTGALLNQDTGAAAATNVEIQLVNGTDGSAVNAFTNVNPQTVTIAGNTGTLSYLARYLAVGGAATQGTVSSSVQYSIVQM